MIELRWVWHDFADGPPPAGAIQKGDVSERRYQKLQYRTIRLGDNWEITEWEDVPHHGLITKDKEA